MTESTNGSNGIPSTWNGMPRHNAAAEKAVLGSMLRDNGCIPAVAHIVGAADFYADSHQRIFRGVMALYGRGTPADAVTLAHLLIEQGSIADIGGYAYLGELWDAAPTAANAEYYAKIVREHSRGRHLAHVCQETLRDALQPVGSVDDLLTRHASGINQQGEIFIRAAIERNGVCANFPQPVIASQLTGSDLKRDWRLEGYLAVGGITLLSALWKGGKTTWLVHLLKALGEGGFFCGQRVTPCGALIVSEEPAHLWVERRDTLGVGDHVHFLIRPFRAKPNFPTWVGFIEHVTNFAKAEGIGLVVIDTLTRVWPVHDENDASQVTEALIPLQTLAEANVAVLLNHHPRKSDGQEATSARGSGALGGFVDVIMELRRFNPSDLKNRRRVIQAFSRYAATPDEKVIELAADDSHYIDCGDRHQATYKERAAVILRVLPGEPPGITVKEILDGWGGDSPAKRTLDQTLAEGLDRGEWRREGAGKKNDPYRFWHTK